VVVTGLVWLVVCLLVRYALGLIKSCEWIVCGILL